MFKKVYSCKYCTLKMLATTVTSHLMNASGIPIIVGDPGLTKAQFLYSSLNSKGSKLHVCIYGHQITCLIFLTKNLLPHAVVGLFIQIVL